ncbi:MAG: DUF4118 domain-containing protein [Oscillospiraceae bacterium]|nr:DUF4118 domain-containing protein [Oscillospiraceae bacterium]
MSDKSSLKRVLLDVGISLFVLSCATALGFLFDHLGFTNSNIMLLYQSGVLLIAILTSHRGYSLISAIATVFLFNFFFVQPKFTLNAYEAGYPVTFIVMFLTAFISSSLAIQLKSSAKEREEAAVLIENERLRSAILRTVSHDLRTPLTSISGNASNLLANEETFDADTRRQLYADIYADSLWLIDLVENLLASTKLENGAALNVYAELVEEIVTEAVQHVRPAEHTQRIEIEPMEMLLVKADARLIVQVITNLINNAVQYTPPDTLVRIRAWQNGDTVFISVADNGPGIAAQDREKLFDSFYVGEGKRSDGRRGLGLGLSLCRTIIHAHGGEISVSDNRPHGAVFTFTLPAEEVAQNG